MTEINMAILGIACISMLILAAYCEGVFDGF